MAKAVRVLRTEADALRETAPKLAAMLDERAADIPGLAQPELSLFSWYARLEWMKSYVLAERFSPCTRDEIIRTSAILRAAMHILEGKRDA